METLRVIESELVPVYVTSTGEKVVYGTGLHEALDVKSNYREWSKRRLAECDAVENKDFQGVEISTPSGQTMKEHIIRLETAKEMAMLERNEKGKQVRRYFIQVEEKYKEGKSQRKVSQNTENRRPPLPAVNNAVKILTGLTEKAGCDGTIQLLTAKSFYENNGYPVLIEIGADKKYWDTVHIARQVGIYTKSSGKPADKAVNEIIRRIEVTEADYTDTWESKGNWQGTVRKYSDDVITRVACWITDNDYPSNIEYRQTNGELKAYHVIYQSREVA